MNAQKAYHRYGIREADVTIEPWPFRMRASVGWAVTVPNENRPHGKQELTCGRLFACIEFKIALRKEHERLLAQSTSS